MPSDTLGRAISRRAVLGGLAGAAAGVGTAFAGSERPTPGPGSITFLGHAGFRIETAARRVMLIDPWIAGNPAWPSASRQPDRADLVLVTHGHTDHLDKSIGQILERTGATLVAPTPVAEYVKARSPGASIVEMNKGGTTRLHGIDVTLAPAVHEAWIRDDGGRIAIPHEGAGFIVRLEGGYCFYHAGDTAVFSDMALIGRIYRPDLAMLPIGGLHTMGPVEAAVATEMLGVRTVIPMHYGTFTFLSGTPAMFASALERQGTNVRIETMAPGKSVPIAAH